MTEVIVDVADDGAECDNTMCGHLARLTIAPGEQDGRPYCFDHADLRLGYLHRCGHQITYLPVAHERATSAQRRVIG